MHMKTKEYDCKKCEDNGVLEMGSDIQSTRFCHCDKGEETLMDMADGQSAMDNDHGHRGEW